MLGKDLICFDDPNQIKFDGPNVYKKKSLVIIANKCSTDTCIDQKELDYILS